SRRPDGAQVPRLDPAPERSGRCRGAVDASGPRPPGLRGLASARGQGAAGASGGGDEAGRLGREGAAAGHDGLARAASHQARGRARPVADGRGDGAARAPAAGPRRGRRQRHEFAFGVRACFISEAMPPMAPPVGLRLERLEGRLARFGARLRGAGDVSIRDVKQDSRRVEPGDLFAVRRGERTDGARFVAQAVAAGAAAILAEARTLSEPPGVPLLEVDAIDPALAFAAEAVHGDPSGTLGVIGITGTNGKTTSAWLTAAALDGAGARTA